MSSPLTLHEASKLRLTSLLSETMPQSILLSGQDGVGLLTIALYLAGRDQTKLLQPVNAKGQEDLKGGTIGIEAIRDLYGHTRTRTSRKRIIIIDNAERMSRGAQAAFLKLLEEPSESTYFILTSHTPNSLLPTIRSRVQHTPIQAITTSQSSEYITSLGVNDEKKVKQLLFLGDGLPAELTRLISNDEYFTKRAAIINDARTLITADTYQKLRIVQHYRQDREGALQLIDGAMTILKYSLAAKPQPSVIFQLDQLLNTRERITGNQNVSLQLTLAVL